MPALTAASGGSQLANFLCFVETITYDNGTILNGESLPSPESCITVTANQKVTTAAAPTPGSNGNSPTGTQGYRVYVIDPTFVSGTVITGAGTGYTTPQLTFNGGTCSTTPTATVTVGGLGATGGYVAWANITNAGACTVAPTSITISGDSCSGVTATLATTGTSPNISVSKITITNNGSSCGLPTIASSGGGVNGLVAAPLITSSGTAGDTTHGTLTGVQILNPGYYTALPTAVPTGTLSGGGASAQGTFTYQFGGEMLQPSSICSASTGIHATLNICDSSATVALTVAPSYLLGMYPPYVAEWLSTITSFTSTTSVGIADVIPNAVSGNVTNGAEGTDNSAAFASALAACPSTNTIKQNPGCSIYFPPVDGTTGTPVPTGRYFFNGGALIAQNNVYLLGAGEGTSGNAGAQALGTVIPGTAATTYARGWTGPQPPSEIVVFSRDWAARWKNVEGGGARNLAVGDLIGQSPGGFFLDGGSSVGVNSDHFTLRDTQAENFSDGDCYAADSAQIFWVENPQGAGCRNGVRMLDNVSNPQFQGGAFSGSQAINQTSQGPSFCIWESNNPNSPAAPGNGQYFKPECRDFATGWFFSYDHPGAQVLSPKYENIAMNVGEAAINQQAAMGVGLRLDSFLGSNLGRCTGSQHIGGQFSRINQDWYNGANCTSNDVLFPNGVPPTANGDLVYVDKGTRSDFVLGNGMYKAAAGSFNGGFGNVPDAMSANQTTVDCTAGLMHRESVTNATLTLGAPTGCVDNEEVSFELTNNSGSTSTISWNAAYTNGFGTLTSVANLAVCTVKGHWNAANSVVVYDSGATSAGACNGGPGAAITAPSQVTQNVLLKSGSSSANQGIASSLTDNGTTLIGTEVLYGVNGVSLVTATSVSTTTFTTTGLALPATPSAQTARGRCVGIWEQATGVSTVTFGMGTGVATTDAWVNAAIWNGSAAPAAAPSYTVWATSTVTAVTAATAPGAINTPYRFEIDFLVKGLSSPFTVTLYVETGAVADAAVIEPGSYCEWLP
jgi:hypothetical protein